MKTNGVTLMELLVVIAVIGVLAAIALPAFHLMSRGARLTNASKTITDTLSGARQMAITQQIYSYHYEKKNAADIVIWEFHTKGERSRYVEFDIPKNRYRTSFWVNKQATPYNMAEKHYKKLAIEEWIELPDKIEFLEEGDYHYPPEYVRFTSSGIAYSSESLSVPIIFDFAIIDHSSGEGAKAKTRVITVQGITGMAKAEAK